MIDQGKKSVLGILVDAVDYDAALTRIVQAAFEKRPYAVSALAVHGVMTGAQDSAQRYRLNQFDLVVPDGQPVRWAMNLLYRTRLRERVYGPELMVCVASVRIGPARQAFWATMRAQVEVAFPAPSTMTPAWESVAAAARAGGASGWEPAAVTRA